MQHLLLLAKCPAPGTCKTRLIPRLGQEGAARFAHAALVDLLHLASKKTAFTRKTWFYAPVASRQIALDVVATENLEKEWEIYPQSELEGKDLGHRLAAAFTWAKGLMSPQEIANSSVTFIGMDCFDLTAQRLNDAASAAALHSSAAAQVLPAKDGGYVLLSLPASCAENIFDNIPWSCDKTCEAQIDSIKKQGVDVCVGETLGDVDEPSDIDDLIGNGPKLRAKFPRTFAVLNDLLST